MNDLILMLFSLLQLSAVIKHNDHVCYTLQVYVCKCVYASLFHCQISYMYICIILQNINVLYFYVNLFIFKLFLKRFNCIMLCCTK